MFEQHQVVKCIRKTKWFTVGSCYVIINTLGKRVSLVCDDGGFVTYSKEAVAEYFKPVDLTKLNEPFCKLPRCIQETLVITNILDGVKLQLLTNGHDWKTLDDPATFLPDLCYRVNSHKSKGQLEKESLVKELAEKTNELNVLKERLDKLEV